MARASQGQYTSDHGKTTPAPPYPAWLVVSAWSPELATLRRALRSASGARVRHRLTVATIGVGLVEASVGTTRLLTQLRPQAVIMVGSAGVYPGGPAFQVGEAVAVDEAVLLAQTLPGRHAYLPSLVPARARTTPRLTQAISKAAALAVASVANPLAITRSPQAAAFAARRSQCALENLETFALARAAKRLGVPCAVVLGIANTVGPAAHRQWRENAAGAASAACRAVLSFLDRQE
ncbi:MAG: hypothetical protein ABSB49_16305 [Polyangia bacterium]